MSTVFSDILAGKIAVHRIDEDEHCLAFLDIKPVNPGHTLVIPKKEVDYFFDLSDEDLARLMRFAKKVAKAIRAAVPCQKVGVMVAGLEVRHAHVHLIPIHASVKELNFANAKETPQAELARMAERIRKGIDV